jgi:hypothetical protein
MFITVDDATTWFSATKDNKTLEGDLYQGSAAVQIGPGSAAGATLACRSIRIMDVGLPTIAAGGRLGVPAALATVPR